MHPQRPPDLKAIPFKLFADLAEVVEKYQVYGAIEVCKILRLVECVVSRALIRSPRSRFFKYVSGDDPVPGTS